MADTRERSRLHMFSTTFSIMIAMAVLDAYLVQQNSGSRRTGVLVMLIVGDICLLLALKFVGKRVGKEVRTDKRGCSITVWFLIMFILDIKTYFILENVRKSCFRQVDSSVSRRYETTNGQPKSIFQPQITFSGSENLTTENLMLAYAKIGVRSEYETVLKSCDYSIWTKKTLSVFQATFISGFYLLLLGADYQQRITSLRELEEIKMRAFWVVADILDLLDLQSSMWESKQGELPYLTIGFIYFYCYIILIVLPSLSLVEINKCSENKSHEMLIYLVTSLITINIATTVIRLVLLINNGFWGVSAIFMAKNVICLCLKSTKLIQIQCAKKEGIPFVIDHSNHFTLNDLKRHGSIYRCPKSCGTDTAKLRNTQEEICEATTSEVALGMSDKERSTTKITGSKFWSPDNSNSDKTTVSRGNNQCNALMAKLSEIPITDLRNTISLVEFTPAEAPGWTKLANFKSKCSQDLVDHDTKSVDAAVNNNLSPENSSKLVFNPKTSQSASGTLDMLSDDSMEKKVRFQMKKLSPVSSEERQTYSRVIQLADGSGVNYDLEPVLQTLPTFDRNALHSSENNMSTADCATNMEDIQAWNANVLYHIKDFQASFCDGNFSQISAEIRSPQSQLQSRSDLVNTASNDCQQPTACNGSESESLNRMIPPFPVINMPRLQCITLPRSEIPEELTNEFSQSDDLRNHFSPDKPALKTSPSIESSTAASAAILPPAMDVSSNCQRVKSTDFFNQFVPGKKLFNGFSGEVASANFLSPIETKHCTCNHEQSPYDNAFGKDASPQKIFYVAQKTQLSTKMVNASSQTALMEDIRE